MWLLTFSQNFPNKFSFLSFPRLFNSNEKITLSLPLVLPLELNSLLKRLTKNLVLDDPGSLPSFSSTLLKHARYQYLNVFFSVLYVYSLSDVEFQTVLLESRLSSNTASCICLAKDRGCCYCWCMLKFSLS